MIDIDVNKTRNARASEIEQELKAGDVTAMIKTKDGEYHIGSFVSLNLDASGRYVVEVTLDA